MTGIELNIPDFFPESKRIIKHLVLDLNGTIAYHGTLIQELSPLIHQLKPLLESIYILSADTYGKATGIATELGISLHRVSKDHPSLNEAQQKAEFVRSLGAGAVYAMGNGRNDALMLSAAAIGCAVLGGEGLAVSALTSANILVKSPQDGLSLLLHPQSLRASLRS
eukprot:gnl/Dysnectes_brevis/6943_a11204_485.p1 GENE.gnl/Dysnectes_brevis/6943_a11204_485~~gnl/Dysnectes_brevis/6943_a11204_485.p1  ORF type:complete len:167 (-),score=8.03 gnl/Dysnectes_brevis/6943_a11204_485:38-538(-)